MSGITFLGTGGGRFVTLNQRRYTGGIWMEISGVNLVVDPGPGALIRALQFGKKPEKLDAIFMSHNHLDHYADAEVLIEAMTGGAKKKRGSLVTTKETLSYISDYHKGSVGRILTPGPGERISIEKEVMVEALPTYLHSNARGFRFFAKSGQITYTADTAFSENLLDYYKGSRILIINVIFPRGKEIKTHLNTKGALEIVKNVKPDVAVISHFGMQMLSAGPEKEAGFIEKESGVKTIAARDGMVLDMDSGGVSYAGGGGDDAFQLKLAGFSSD